MKNAVSLSSIMESVLGPMAGHLKPETFTLQRNGSGLHQDSDILSTKGCRFVSASEAEPGQVLATGLIKRLTGSDIVSARGPYEPRPTQWRPCHKMFYSSNYKPRLDSPDPGFARRLIFIPFLQKFSDEIPFPPGTLKADPALVDRIISDELPGVLAWLVRGFQDWRQQGLRPPSSVIEAARDFLDEASPVSTFLNACTQQDPGAEIAAQELYRAYQDWHSSQGGTDKDCLSAQSFGRKISNLLTKVKRNNGRFYQNIKLQ